MRASWVPTGSGIALSILSAVLLTLAFPPYHLGLLIGVAFVPMLVAQHRLMPPKLSSLAPTIAIGGWLGAFLIPIFGSGSLLVSAAIPLGTGLLAFLMDRQKRAFHMHTGYRWFVLEGVVGWVGFEMIRAFIPAIGTWGFVGYPLWEHPWLIQPLSVFGIYGLDLLIMLCNYALALGTLALIDRNGEEVKGRMVARWLGAAGVLLAAWVVFSIILYRAQPADPETVRVAAVQPNLPRAAHRDAITTPDQRLEALARLTREAAAQGAEVVVWPEMALGFDPQVEYTAALQSLAAETGAYLVIGYVLDDAQGFRNEAAVLAPDGAFLGVYGKTHPMIASGEPRTAQTGPYAAYETPVGQLAAMICFDAHFTDVARRLARQGAQVIAVPSLFGPPLAELPYTQIVFRAIENRAAVVMADVAYNSAIVDPYGHVLELAITPEGAETLLVSDVPLYNANTLYSRLGDWPGWLSLAGLAAFAILMPVTLRQGTAKGEAHEPGITPA
nr:hypothetical protein [Anaerolineae bacterium]